MKFAKTPALAVLMLLAISGFAQQWVPLGPDGGDVRSLTRDPHDGSRILLGTSAGQLYESKDSGKHWARFAHLGTGNDFVLDHVVFDPSSPGRIYVAAWSVENAGGDLFVSTDNGASWSTMNALHGKSIRAFAMAPSNPKTLVAGALDGVFRSNDAGTNWAQISPPNHAEIRNIESLAIDPKDPNSIYAGTWHLPWKTSDGGATWKNIKNGMIDDSDVFSIIVDPHSPNVVYVSACSGIYKSENGADLFHKAQGIPFSSRRTRVLQQDPQDPNTVYAGTTEGLWRTRDSGHSWTRITAPNIIVNDVLIDPADTRRVLLATDRSGVLATEDGGATFVASNHGFSHRQVATLIEDKDSPETLYAGVINDKEFGGVFVSHDGGINWMQKSNGLQGKDVFTLTQAPKGSLLAGTNRGVYELREDSEEWQPVNTIINVTETTTRARAKGKKTAKPVVQRKVSKGTLAARVNDLQVAGGKWFAATSNGLYVSGDAGHSWHGGPIEGENELVGVRVAGDLIVAVARKGAVISLDGGNTWVHSKLPAEITAVTDVAVDSDANIYLASREGAYKTSNAGEQWTHLRRLPANNLSSIFFDAGSKKLYTTSMSTTKIFESVDGGSSWQQSESGWLVRSIRPVGSRILATTAFDGIVAQPDGRSRAMAAVSSGRGSRN